jgi:probable DNA repair protein
MPQVANPNPFIPIDFARKHLLPSSGPERELEFAQSLVNALLATSAEVHVSYYRMDNDRELSLSPLVSERIQQWLPLPDFVPLAKRIVPHSREAFRDDSGLPLTDNRLRGGSAFLQAQSLCPMQGYLGYRLKIMEQQSAELGIEPMDRGQFVHRVMQRVWSTLKDQQALRGKSDEELFTLVEQEIEHCLEQHFHGSGLLKTLEKEKYLNLILDLLNLEKKRQPFTVVACEKEVEIQLNGLTLLARMDRVDQLDNSDLAVIDYKTGKVNIQKWFGDRIAEPQLPLYLLSDKEHIAALCFAQIHHEGVLFAGVSAEEELFPKVKTIEAINNDIEDWPSFISHLEQCLIEIAHQIKQGYAAVDPATNLRACDFCPYDSICRIGELEPELIKENDE